MCQAQCKMLAKERSIKCSHTLYLIIEKQVKSRGGKITAKSLIFAIM